MTPLSSVLIVDDEPAVRDLMARWIASLGLRPKTAASADEALEALREQHCDLAVIDVMMPGHDGLWLATQLQRDHPHTAVVIATAYTELLDGDSRPLPIADLLVKPFQRDRFALAVDRGRQWRKETLEEIQWQAQLAAEVNDRIEQVITAVAQRASGADEADALNALATLRMPETMAHSERVSRYAQSVAREMRVEGELGTTLELAARFHDIGKIAMPDALLTKPSPLTPGELAIMRRHVELGAEILQATGALASIAPLVLTSHEWFNGGGPPEAGRFGYPARHPYHHGGRRLRRDDPGPLVSPGVASAGRHRRALALHADAVRPRHRGRVPQRPRHSLKPRASNFRLPTSDFRLQTPDSRLRNVKLP